MRHILRSFVLAFALATVGGTLVVSQVAVAAAPLEEVPVKVVVTDEEGKPISTAAVRHPLEAERHRVNTFDGSFEASVLYLPDGSELKFVKGMVVEFEVSAPGYVNTKFQYTVRARKNVVPVTLQKMVLDIGDPDEEDPVIQFGRDKPIDGSNGDPAN